MSGYILEMINSFARKIKIDSLTVKVSTLKNHQQKGMKVDSRSRDAAREKLISGGTRPVNMLGAVLVSKATKIFRPLTWVLVGLTLAVYPLGSVFAQGTDAANQDQMSVDPTPTPAIENYPSPALQNQAIDPQPAGSSQSHVYLPIVNKVEVQTVFYVSPSGNDSNPGTQAKPWKTIQKAASTLVAGQTGKILPGTYTAKFTPANSGKTGAYITYTADPGTVILDGSGLSLSGDAKGDGLVQIQGKSFIKVQNLTLRNSSMNCVNISENSSGTRSSYIEITGLSIQNCTKVGIRARFTDHVLIQNNTINHIIYSSGVGIWWNTYATVDHNTITNAHYYHECQGAYDEALTVSGTNYFEVKNNTLDNTEANPAGFCSNAEKLGINTKESSQNGKIYANSVRHMSAGGIYLDAWHAGANGTPTLNHVDIYQNKVGEGGGINVGCEQADGVVEYINIYNNLVVNASLAAIQVRGAHGDGLRKNIRIYNNTIYGALTAGGNGGAGIFVTTANLGSNNSDAPVIIRNNISMFDFSAGNAWVGQIVAADSTIAGKIAADHNLVSGPQKCSTTYPGCVEVGSRTTADASSVFTNPDGLDFHLKSGSPAINTGITVNIVTIDLDGIQRPQPIDIGAYEYR
jgi:hypothetical protein